MKRARQAPARLEKYEQADGVQLLRSIGATVYVLGTVRRATDYHGTMQTPGLPDVQAFLPRRLAHQPRLLMWEVKRTGGRIRAEQAEFRRLCLGATVDHVVGDLSTLMAWLVEHGYLRAEQLPASRQPAAMKGTTQ
jgi:hypothetical protein